MSRIVDRLLLFVYSFVIGAISVAAILAALGLMGRPIDFTEPFLIQTTVIATAAVLFLLSVRFFYVSIRRERASLPSIDQRTDIGDIKISLETIENVALKAAARVRGVKDLKARIRTNEAGLDIMIRTVVDGETAIPSMTEEVQCQVRDYVQEITGIPVSYVSVYVANIVQTQTFKARVE
ncbi:alkaline shock response membrane anchor protein AmaP [Paenibacillus profundus]|uniref:Alkaline shock response membrane anchor protein AmaP n=1 Tax=Paenibacillus profundus TaxID=1173085 RepID=A0ABS8YPJ2_9BACL|nr:MULTISPECIES: alkaline shock response membrane anchor protein AmaP [Paenibacillus]MCE5173187.1 alkaline shock response membrane anchor protein AmaP [Paenibacillus profundus]MCM3340263.1 alkaline shock response membrane anchor protein AmaP [Paenibacillus sp. MER TA 81-3]